MGFFDPPPPPAEPGFSAFPGGERIGPPANVVGGATGVRLELARTARAAVYVRDLVAYPVGAELLLDVRRRLPARSREDDPFGYADHRPGTSLPETVLRFGVQVAGGARAASLGPYEWGDRQANDGPMLVARGGFSDGGRYQMGFWLSPLPPAGPLAFVVEWPSEGVAETRVELDSAALSEAAAHAVTLWEDEP